MKINELKRIAKENDYKYEYDESRLRTRFKREVEGYTNKISINEWNENCMWISNDYFCDEKDFKMIKATMKYAETPLEDREEIKKYFYEHNSMKTKGGNPTYLAIRQRPSISYPVLQGSSKDVFEYKVEFTDDEIEIFKKEYGICLDDFEKNEVEE